MQRIATQNLTYSSRLNNLGEDLKEKKLAECDWADGKAKHEGGQYVSSVCKRVGEYRQQVLNASNCISVRWNMSDVGRTKVK